MRPSTPSSVASPFAALILAGALLVPSLSAEEPSRNFLADLTSIDRLLREGAHQEARESAVRVADEMIESLGPGETAAYALGVGLTYRAVAEAGLGRPDVALWYWHVALNIAPDVADLDLDAYGEAGLFLAAHPLLPPGAASAGLPECRDQGCPPGIEPLKIHDRSLHYPEGARRTRVTGQLVLQVVVDETGGVSDPRLLKDLEAPTLAYAAFEAVRAWRFEPGRVGGEPVKVLYTLEVNYTLETE